MPSNVFEQLGFDAEEAANLRLRAELTIAIADEIRRQGWTQTEAAERLHTDQARISELMHDRSSKFSLDKLVNFATDCGLEVDLSTKHKEPA